jgi:hypothetical protein
VEVAGGMLLACDLNGGNSWGMTEKKEGNQLDAGAILP